MYREQPEVYFNNNFLLIVQGSTVSSLLAYSSFQNFNSLLDQNLRIVSLKVKSRLHFDQNPVKMLCRRSCFSIGYEINAIYFAQVAGEQRSKRWIFGKNSVKTVRRVWSYTHLCHIFWKFLEKVLNSFQNITTTTFNLKFIFSFLNMLVRTELPNLKD